MNLGLVYGLALRARREAAAREEGVERIVPPPTWLDRLMARIFYCG